MNVQRFGEVYLEVAIGGRLDHLLRRLKNEFPNLTFQFKTDHWWWIVVHWIVLICTFGGNKNFLKLFTTTIGMIIGLSEKYTKMIKEKPQGWEDRLWSCLMHEREHLVDFKRLGVFLVFIGYVFVFFPVGLAYIRARMERRGYIQTLKCWYLLDPDWAMGLTRNSKGQTARQWWINQFTGGNYGYCFPFKKIVGGWYDQELSRLQRAAA